MTSRQPQIVAPWNTQNPPEAVSCYTNPFELEFSVEDLCSEVPYRGPVSGKFRRSATSELDRSGFHRFTNRHPTVIWEPRSHQIINPLTADLLAAAEALGGELHRRGSPAGPFGIHASGTDVWIGLCDGGVGVEVNVWESETTNRVFARQRTTIHGAAAFRMLTRALGFDHMPRKLHGENARPDLEAIDRDLIGRLRSGGAQSR